MKIVENRKKKPILMVKNKSRSIELLRSLMIRFWNTHKKAAAKKYLIPGALNFIIEPILCLSSHETMMEPMRARRIEK